MICSINISRRWKCFLSILLAVSISLCIFTMPSAACGFSDVSRSDSSVVDYFDAINWISDNGYMVGTSETTFSPSMYVSRAMAICVIWRYAGRPAPPPYTNTFDDVSPSSWYYEAVLWGVAHGIVYGTSSTTFSPGTTVTREQMMAFLYRYAANIYGNDLYNCGENEASLCLDAYLIYPSLQSAMQWSVSNGIIPWTANDPHLYPTAPIQRKELALFLNRYSCNVDGMKQDERFSFANSSSFFQSGLQSPKYYMITGLHLAKLHSKLNTSQYVELRDAINNKRLGEWRGACYGMSLICILDKTGKIDFNKNCANNCNNLYQIPNLQLYFNNRHTQVIDNVNLNYFSKAESGIHYHQLSYQQLLFFESIITTSGGIIFAGSFLHQDICEFISKREHCDFELFSYYWFVNETNEVNGHSVVVYGHPYFVEGAYQYHVYDPSDPNTEVWLIANPYTDSISLSNHPERTIYRAEYLNSFEFSNIIDLDGDYNND